MLPPRQELIATVFYMMSWNFNGLRNMEHMGCQKEAQPLGGTELIHTLGGTDQTQTLDGATAFLSLLSIQLRLYMKCQTH